MKRFLPAFMSFLLLPCVVHAQKDYPLRDAVECNPRAGLPNFLAKAEAGKALKIAYLGGSITAASGWRVQSREWLVEVYPDAKFQEIHAAIGGTGSDLGVFRLERDVLRHRPDLLFVEFAVNDGGASPERIHKAMEGIVRQTIAADPTIDICFVYTLTQQMLKELQGGKMPRAASAMEELADLYRIPSVHFGVKVAELEKTGKLVFKAAKPKDPAASKPMVFSSDGVHPFVETGHRLYVEAIGRSWPGIVAASGKPAPHKLPKPLREDHWQKARLVSIKPEMLSGQWTKLAASHTLSKRFKRNLPELYQATEPGATLSFVFKGSMAGVFDILGPDGGQLRVQIDGEEPFTRNRIDPYCTYHRMSKLDLAKGVEPGRHMVRITLTSEILDKREILFERNRADFDKKPKKYEAHTWYAGSLMVIGEVE